MSLSTAMIDRIRDRVPVRYLPQTPPQQLEGTWRQARPARIDAALRTALANGNGGWMVAATSQDVGAERSVARTIAGRELVLWRGAAGEILAGSAVCPHLGAALGGCDVIAGQMLCRWHGMPLGRDTNPPWATIAAFDDGILVWVQMPGESAGFDEFDGFDGFDEVGGLGGSERRMDADAKAEADARADAAARADIMGHPGFGEPALPVRPDPKTAITSVISLQTVCEPRDIIANRLDPWHGAWLHPYAFSDLRVDERESSDEKLVLDVAYRLGRRFAVPVRAEFTCPDSQTIVMTITDGEGTGSIVETHATSLTARGIHPARTVMTEVVMATSPRLGFALARRCAPMIQAGMRASAIKLWQDDLEYAARLYELRRSLSRAMAARATPGAVPNLPRMGTVHTP